MRSKWLIFSALIAVSILGCNNNEDVDGDAVNIDKLQTSNTATAVSSNVASDVQVATTPDSQTSLNKQNAQAPIDQQPIVQQASQVQEQPIPMPQEAILPPVSNVLPDQAQPTPATSPIMAPIYGQQNVGANATVMPPIANEQSPTMDPIPKQQYVDNNVETVVAPAPVAHDQALPMAPNPVMGSSVAPVVPAAISTSEIHTVLPASSTATPSAPQQQNAVSGGNGATTARSQQLTVKTK